MIEYASYRSLGVKRVRRVHPWRIELMKCSVVVIFPVERERARGNEFDSIFQKSEMTGTLAHMALFLDKMSTFSPMYLLKCIQTY